MTKGNLKTTIMLMAFVSLIAMSCNNSTNDDSADTVQSEVSAPNAAKDSKADNPEAKRVLADYMLLKDALVETDEKAAAEAGKKLESTLKDLNLDSFNSDQQKELKEIIESATEHAEHISRSDIAHQREHFQMLSQDVTDMVAITGTENTLYQQFCPMYGDDGGAWLSMENNIRNPYFGSKMMTCGEVQKEIN